MQCAGEVVLVTGAQQGIGRAMGVEFAAAGADVAVNWLDDESAAETVAAEIRGHPGWWGDPQSRRISLGSTLDEVQSMVSAAEDASRSDRHSDQQCRRFPARPVSRFDRKRLGPRARRQFEGFLFLRSGCREDHGFGGPARGDHQSDLRRGISQSPRGACITVASKGGVLSMTRADGAGVAPYRIRVNAIAPGLTDTAQPRYGISEAELAEAARSIPLGRMARPEEIARAAVFLVIRRCGFRHRPNPAR